MERSTSIWFSATSSERRTGGSLVRHLWLVALGVTTASAAARAQGSVSGTVSLDERSGVEPGDIRTAVVYLEPKGGTAAPSNAPPLRSRTIAMRGREFLPHVSLVLTGGSVAFPNQDPFSHNVFSNVDVGSFDLGLYRRGATRAATFSRPGVYPIYCNIHSKMVSFVVAVPTPWAVQPDDDGRFTMRDVPAGTYVVHAWHERGASETRREIVVPASGIASLQLTIDARSYVEAPHLNKFGRPYAVIRADRY